MAKWNVIQVRLKEDTVVVHEGSAVVLNKYSV